MMKNYRCEICGNDEKILLEMHHIKSKSKGGKNKQSNIVTLCVSCHKKVHNNIYILEGKFLTSEGFQLIYRTNTEETITGNKPDVWIIPNAKKE